MAARTVKRRHVSTKLSGKLLILFSVSIFCVVVLVTLALFTLNSNSTSTIRISNVVFDGPPKIAFLFLVRQNIPLDFLWGAFFQVPSISSASFVIFFDDFNFESFFFFFCRMVMYRIFRFMFIRRQGFCWMSLQQGLIFSMVDNLVIVFR